MAHVVYYSIAIYPVCLKLEGPSRAARVVHFYDWRDTKTIGICQLGWIWRIGASVTVKNPTSSHALQFYFLYAQSIELPKTYRMRPRYRKSARQSSSKGGKTDFSGSGPKSWLSESSGTAVLSRSKRTTYVRKVYRVISPLPRFTHYGCNIKHLVHLQNYFLLHK